MYFYSEEQQEEVKGFIDDLSQKIEEISINNKVLKGEEIKQKIKDQFQKPSEHLEIKLKDGKMFRGFFSLLYPQIELRLTGKMINPDGCEFEGKFSNFNPTGEIRETLPNGKVFGLIYNNGVFYGATDVSVENYPLSRGGQKCLFTGTIDTNGLPKGKGTIIFENGDTYEGGFKDGKFHGYGVYCYNKHNLKLVYKGYWSNGKKHQKGTLTNANRGFIYNDVWENGKPKYAQNFSNEELNCIADKEGVFVFDCNALDNVDSKNTNNNYNKNNDLVAKPNDIKDNIANSNQDNSINMSANNNIKNIDDEIKKQIEEKSEKAAQIYQNLFNLERYGVNNDKKSSQERIELGIELESLEKEIEELNSKLTQMKSNNIKNNIVNNDQNIRNDIPKNNKINNNDFKNLIIKEIQKEKHITINMGGVQGQYNGPLDDQDRPNGKGGEIIFDNGERITETYFRDGVLFEGKLFLNDGREYRGELDNDGRATHRGTLFFPETLEMEERFVQGDFKEGRIEKPEFFYGNVLHNSTFFQPAPAEKIEPVGIGLTKKQCFEFPVGNADKFSFAYAGNSGNNINNSNIIDNSKNKDCVKEKKIQNENENEMMNNGDNVINTENINDKKEKGEKKGGVNF